MDILPLVQGFAGCIFAVVTFGSFFVPIKRCNPGDGLYVQWAMSIAILMVGFGLYCFEGFPQFYPVSMIGGLLWSVGNAISVKVLEELGLGVSMILFNVLNCSLTWATGYFGLFGTKARRPDILWLNIVGLCMVVAGAVFTALVEGTPRNGKSKDLSVLSTEKENKGYTDPESQSNSIEKSKGFSRRKIIAMVMSLIAGIFYGTEQTPIIAIEDNPELFGSNVSQDSMPHLFGHFMGIFVGCSSIFLIYCFVKKGKPEIDPEITLPSFFTGTLFALSQIAYFYATNRLSQAITGPIVSMVPASVSVLWSVFYFKEIEGPKNLQMVALAIFISTGGGFAISLSKIM